MKKLISSFVFILTSIFSKGQTKFPELSPPGFIKQNIGFTILQLSYERPAVRGRKIFGGLVPFNKVWRTGAGGCSKFSLTQPILLNGKKLTAGTYSIFTIPGLNEWTLILNKDTTLYDAFDYDSLKDVVRVKMKPTKSNRFYESLTFDIDVISYDAKVYISWENTRVYFTVKTFTDEITMEDIKQNLLSGKSTDWNEYADAADYYLYNNKNLNEAISLANRAIENNGELFSYIVKIQVLEKQKKYKEAIEVGAVASEFIKKRGLELGYNINEELKSLDKRILKIKQESNRN